MVDEFQDTDPIQWKVIDRAFTGCSTVILIGDPKQAIYAFRGGDIVTYLEAAETAGEADTGDQLAQRRGLVDRLQVVLEGASSATRASSFTRSRRDTRAADWPGAVQRPVPAASGLAGVVRRRGVRDSTDRRSAGAHRRRTWPADIGALLSSGATFGGRADVAGDIAVIVEKHRDGHACFKALTGGDPGCPHR